MLHRRLLSSAVVISLILLGLWFEYRLGRDLGHRGLLAVLLVGLVGLWSGEELRRLFATQVRLSPGFVLGTLALGLATSCAPIYWTNYPQPCVIGQLGWLALAYALVLGVPMLAAILTYRPGTHQLLQISCAFFVCGYVLLLSFVCQLRFALPNDWGIVALFSLLLTVKMSDSFAYLVGRVWGRRKMSPQLSPGKTVEGGIAALVFGCLGAIVALYPLAYAITGQVAVRHVGVALVFGLVVTLAGIGGDLAESLIKRELGHKDSGGLIPGMGGILDVIDSVLVAAPVVYIFWATGWVGPGV